MMSDSGALYRRQYAMILRAFRAMTCLIIQNCSVATANNDKPTVLTLGLDKVKPLAVKQVVLKMSLY